MPHSSSPWVSYGASIVSTFRIITATYRECTLFMSIEILCPHSSWFQSSDFVDLNINLATSKFLCWPESLFHFISIPNSSSNFWLNDGILTHWPMVTPSIWVTNHYLYHDLNFCGFSLRALSQETLNIHIVGLVQDCNISSVLAMEILQSCTKPSIYQIHHIFHGPMG